MWGEREGEGKAQLSANKISLKHKGIGKRWQFTKKTICYAQNVGSQYWIFLQLGEKAVLSILLPFNRWKSLSNSILFAKNFCKSNKFIAKAYLIFKSTELFSNFLFIFNQFGVHDTYYDIMWFSLNFTLLSI